MTQAGHLLVAHLQAWVGWWQAALTNAGPAIVMLVIAVAWAAVFLTGRVDE